MRDGILTMGKQLSAEIFILNYNGKDLMLECLPSILEASAQSPVPCSVTVVDNCSVDGSVEALRHKFPQVKILLPEKNLVLCSYNDAVRESKADIALLLNNDVKVDRDFVAPLIQVFLDHPDAFFAAPKVLSYETREPRTAYARMEFRWGLLWGSAQSGSHEGASQERASGPPYTMQCGNGAFHRARFLELNGYDDLYLPGTVEDTDLCFRAWRRGWKGYRCSSSVIYHKGQTTFKREFGERGIRRINRRNLYLFVWKNIRSPLLLTQHVLFLPLQVVKYIFCRQFEFVEGFFEAIGLLPRALLRRRSDREPSALSDRAIFAISRKL